MPQVDDNGVAAVDEAPAAAERPIMYPGPEVQADEEHREERPKIVVEDGEVRAVAEAMDVDGVLDWESESHSDQIACNNALDEARHMLVGFKACVQVEHEGWKRKHEAREDAELVGPRGERLNPDGTVDPLDQPIGGNLGAGTPPATPPVTGQTGMESPPLRQPVQVTGQPAPQ